MIGPEYRKQYKAIFESIIADKPRDAYYESALLSYLHGNPLISWLFWKRVQAAFTLAGDIEGKTVLDFGCGTGVTFRYFQQNKCIVTGCDIRFIPLAREVARRLRADVELLDDVAMTGDRTFDLIVALDVFEHLDDPGAVLDSLRARMHAGTKLILSGPTETPLYRLGRALAGFSDHSHVRTIYDIESLLKRKGLRHTATMRIFPPVTLFRVSAWAL